MCHGHIWFPDPLHSYLIHALIQCHGIFLLRSIENMCQWQYQSSLALVCNETSDKFSSCNFSMTPCPTVATLYRILLWISIKSSWILIRTCNFGVLCPRIRIWAHMITIRGPLTDCYVYIFIIPTQPPMKYPIHVSGFPFCTIFQFLW